MSSCFTITLSNVAFEFEPIVQRPIHVVVPVAVKDLVFKPILMTPAVVVEDRIVAPAPTISVSEIPN